MSYTEPPSPHEPPRHSVRQFSTFSRHFSHTPNRHVFRHFPKFFSNFFFEIVQKPQINTNWTSKLMWTHAHLNVTNFLFKFIFKKNIQKKIQKKIFQKIQKVYQNLSGRRVFTTVLYGKNDIGVKHHPPYKIRYESLKIGSTCLIR